MTEGDPLTDEGTPAAARKPWVTVATDDKWPDGKTVRVDPQGRRVCTAKGNTCNGVVARGLNVCRMHGGAAPQVRRKARLRLAELVDPAIATLAREMAGADSSSDRQKAANSILDRAGFARATKIEAEDARSILLDRLLEIRQAAYEQAGEPPPPLTMEELEK